MPKGLPNVKVETMTAEELKAASERIADKKSVLREDEFSLPKGEQYTTDDGKRITRVGDFRNKGPVGDAQTLSRFAKIEREDDDGWIAMTPKEAAKMQAEGGLLIGYDQDRQLGLVGKPRRVKK